MTGDEAAFVEETMALIREHIPDYDGEMTVEALTAAGEGAWSAPHVPKDLPLRLMKAMNLMAVDSGMIGESATYIEYDPDTKTLTVDEFPDDV